MSIETCLLRGEIIPLRKNCKENDLIQKQDNHLAKKIQFVWCVEKIIYPQKKLACDAQV